MASIGSTPGLLAAAAVGAAASAALEPAFEVPRQDAWNSNRNRILDPGLLAALVAQGGVDLSDAQQEAHRQGYTDDKLDALVYLAQTVPGIAEALHLWRLGFIDDALMGHVLVKEGLDQRYAAAVLQTKTEELIGLGDIAIAVVRGILPAPSYVPVPVPTQGDKVPRYPQVNIDPELLAAKIGFSPEALQVMVGRSGLSLAPVMAAQALFRGLIAEDDFLIAIGEGDLRTEWATTVRDTARQILTADQYAELQLRGYIDAPTRRLGTQKHGMADADSDNLYNVLGRAPGIHAVTTGLARGGTYDGQPKTIPSPFLEAVERANIRPEWYDVEFANRYSYPSGFQIRAAAQAGELDEAETEAILLEIGWSPKWAAFFATAWTGGTKAGAADPHVKKAQTTLYTEAHKAYVKTGLSQAQVAPALGALNVPPSAQQAVFSLWDMEAQLAAETPPAA